LAATLAAGYGLNSFNSNIYVLPQKGISGLSLEIPLPFALSGGQSYNQAGLLKV
jgi:hypothetical protein